MKTSPESILVYILLLVVEILIHISGVLLPLPLEYLVGLTAGGQVAAQQLPDARAQAGRHARPAHLAGFNRKFQFFANISSNFAKKHINLFLPTIISKTIYKFVSQLPMLRLKIKGYRYANSFMTVRAHKTHEF
jgi:hypothetical protein